MAESLTIPKNPTLEKSEDYAYLREAGIQHLQNLGGRIWTDYNIHDPGVTILEMLCYVLTDLGARTSYNIEDLLALQKGDGYFHTAREVLTVNPTTINDYRKLLVDIEGVKNAWLVPSDQNEIAIYQHAKEPRLTYVPPKPGDLENGRLVLNGLYNVLLEFEEDEEFGDLNDPVLTRRVRLEGKNHEIEFTFPTWMELFAQPNVDTFRTWIDRGVIEEIEVKPERITFLPDLKAYELIAEIKFKAEPNRPPTVPAFGCQKDMALDEYGDAAPVDPGPPTQPPKQDYMLEIAIIARYPGRADIFQPEAIKLIEDNASGQLLEFFRRRLAFTVDIVDRVQCLLMAHRNLCEDFLKIESLHTEEIAVCADIEVKPEADVDRVMAEILHKLEVFISPPINFYTIQELFNDGLTADQIFNGPALQHGFIKDDELDQAILMRELHTSDLIHIIMDVEGVLAVRSLQVANYLEGLHQTTGEYWTLCLKGDGLHVPKLSIDKSKFLFFKDVLPYRANMDDVAQYLAEWRVRAHRGRLKETPLDLEVPEGTDMEVGMYSTMQNQFPQVYGTTKYGIPGEPDALRMAQAKQLKAYLLFMEHVLANYLSQLNHVKELFSMQPLTEHHTYYAQAVKDVKDVEELYALYDSMNEFGPVDAWLKEIAEDTELYEERKNRFLDHLVARFAESFGEYALLMYALRPARAGKEMIEDKLAFLADYPAVSGERGKAFNYKPTRNCERCFPDALWNTLNVSGFKKRVARLMGMPAYHRRNLTGHAFRLRKIEYTTRADVWVWELRDRFDLSRVLLTSIEYESEETANFMITYAIAMVETERLVKRAANEMDRHCCDRVGVDDLFNAPPLPAKAGYALLNECGDVVACSGRYDDLALRDADYQKTIDYILDFCTLENFHLIEHILLRPKYEGQLAGPNQPAKPADTLLPICAEPVENFQTEVNAEFFLDIAGEWRFRVRGADGRILLKSEGFPTLELARRDVELIAKSKNKEVSYDLENSKDGRYYFNIQEPKGEIIGTSRMFDTQKERELGMKELMFGAGVAGGAKLPEQVCMEFADPYSFRISVVLPSWPGRFRDINFRHLVEKTLRQEAPAHIFLRICWIDRDQMAAFECAYMEWLLENGRCGGSPETASPKLNALIDRLFHLTNVYPVATLHDCDSDTGTGAQVVLNYTSLGTL